MVKRRCDKCSIPKTIHFFSKTEWDKGSKRIRVCSSCKHRVNKKRFSKRIGKGSFKEFLIGKGKA